MTDPRKLARTLLLGVLIGLSVAACGERSESGWRVRCTKQEFSHFLLMPIYTGKVMTVVPIAQYRCVRKDSTYFASDDAEGTLRTLHARNARKALRGDTL